MARDLRESRGQATIEAVAGVGALMLTALVGFQFLAAGYTATVADGAATAGAVALTRGEPVEAAVRKALPGWARDRVKVSRAGGRVSVRVDPPSLLPSMSGKFAVTAEANGRSR